MFIEHDHCIYKHSFLPYTALTLLSNLNPPITNHHKPLTLLLTIKVRFPNQYIILMLLIIKVCSRSYY